MHTTQSLPPPHAAQRNEAVLSLIGTPPLVALRMEPEGVTIHAKCEFLNPSGSIKDRLAQCIILDAEKRGLLQPDSIILECTSGNTGISLAMLGAALGHPVAILMSDSASGERRRTAATHPAVRRGVNPVSKWRELSDRHRLVIGNGREWSPVFPPSAV